MHGWGCGGRKGATRRFNDLKRICSVHRWRATSRLIFDFGVSIQISAAIDDFDVLESGSQQTSSIFVDLDGSGNAANIGGNAL